MYIKNTSRLKMEINLWNLKNETVSEIYLYKVYSYKVFDCLPPTSYHVTPSYASRECAVSFRTN